MHVRNSDTLGDFPIVIRSGEHQGECRSFRIDSADLTNLHIRWKEFRSQDFILYTYPRKLEWDRVNVFLDEIAWDVESPVYWDDEF